MSQKMPHQHGVEHAGYLAADFVEALERYNGHLRVLSARLDSVQRDTFGNDYIGRLVLRLYDCQAKCVGCPHPYWRMQHLRRNTKIGHPKYGRMFAVDGHIKSPLHSKRARQCERLCEVIREIQQVIRLRGALIHDAWRMRQRLAKVFPQPPNEVR